MKASLLRFSVLAATVASIAALVGGFKGWPS